MNNTRSSPAKRGGAPSSSKIRPKKGATSKGSARSGAADRIIPKYGRGTGIPTPIDIHVGRRVRIRRQMLGMNQATLADALDLTFQQVQKYESGANRVSASRLSAMAEFLRAPISYFFDDLPPANAEVSADDQARRAQLERPETIEFVRLYYAISDPSVRRQFLEMVKAIAQSVEPGPELRRPQHDRAR